MAYALSGPQCKSENFIDDDLVATCICVRLVTRLVRQPMPTSSGPTATYTGLQVSEPVAASTGGGRLALSATGRRLRTHRATDRNCPNAVLGISFSVVVLR